VENSLTGFSADLFENLYKLVKLGYKPILAHPERYLEIQKNIQFAEDFIHRDVYLQINTGSILGKYDKKTKDIALELIDRGYVHFLGTDCRCHSKVYDFAYAVEVIRKEFDDATVGWLTKDFPEKMLNNEDVPYFYVRRVPPKQRSFFKRLFRLE
jgi:protein-tyrosine phosphatase